MKRVWSRVRVTAVLSLLLLPPLLGACAEGGGIRDVQSWARGQSAASDESAEAEGQSAPASLFEAPGVDRPGPDTEAIREQARQRVLGGIFPATAEPLAALPAGTAPAATEEGGAALLNFVDAELSEVLRFVLGDLLGRSFVLHPEVSGQVTLISGEPLPRAALLDTLEDTLRLYGLAMVERNDRVLEVLPAALASGSYAGAPAPGQRRRPGYGVEVLPLYHIQGEQVRDLIEPLLGDDVVVQTDPRRNLLLVAGPATERARIATAVQSFDADWITGLNFALVPLESGRAADVARELEGVFGQRTTLSVVPIARMNALLLAAPSLSVVQQADTWARRLDQVGEGEERRLHVYFAQHARVPELARILNQVFSTGATSQPSQPEVAPGLQPATLSRGFSDDQEGLGQDFPPAAGSAPFVGFGQGLEPPSAAAEAASGQGQRGLRIIPDPSTNSLVVMATAKEYDLVLAALRQLDVEPLQVLVEATIAEITLRDNLQFGIEWFLRRGGSSFQFVTDAAGTIAAPGSGFSYVLREGSVQALLTALSEVTDLRVISAPQIVVLDNQTASIVIGDQVPIISQERTDLGTVGTNDSDRLTRTIEYRDTGVILNVTPRVNANGFVSMTVAQEVSNVDRTLDTGRLTPTFRQRKVQTAIAVQNGETVVLGGFISDSTQRGTTGVPILMDVPLLGAAFRSERDLQERTELIVLITPRTIGNVAQARRVTEELRRRLDSLETLQRRIQ